jgi:hypothetical protein
VKNQEASNSSGLGYKGGGGIKVLLYLFVFPLLLFIVALFLLLVPLPPPFPPPGSSARNLPVAILTGLSGIAFLVWIANYSQSRIRKASQSMDPVFLKRGFRLGKAYAFARTFQGTHQGLSISGDLFPDYKLQPWRFNINANVSPCFQAILSNRKPVIHLPNATKYSAEGELSSTFIYCDRPESMEKMLERPEVMQALSSILNTLNTSDTWQLILQPQKTELRIMSYRLSSESVEIWLDGYYRLLTELTR